jgi:hypothetical protein
MKTAIRRDVATVSVCRRMAWIPGQRQAREAKKAERREGEIKQSGTLSGRFGKLLLSAHWLGSLVPAPCFRARGAAGRLSTLALRRSGRHYHAKSAISAPVRPKARQ